MRSTILYIIAVFLLTLFAYKEVVADLHIISTQQETICECESENTERSLEERGAEHEQKLITETFALPHFPEPQLAERPIYQPPYIGTAYTGTITPPPKFSLS